MPREADLRDDVEKLHSLLLAGRTDADVERFGSLASAGSPLLGNARELAAGSFRLYQQTRYLVALHDSYDVVRRSQDKTFIDPTRRLSPPPIDQPFPPFPFVPVGIPTGLPTGWTWGPASTARVITLMLRLLGLTASQADELTCLIITAEGSTVADVEAKLPEVMALGNDDVMEELRERSVLTSGMQAAFTLFGSQLLTTPSAPVMLRWLSAVGSDHSPAVLTRHSGQPVSRPCRYGSHLADDCGRHLRTTDIASAAGVGRSDKPASDLVAAEDAGRPGNRCQKLRPD